MRRAASRRTLLLMSVAGYLWRRLRGPATTTATVRVPRGARVVVQAVRDTP